MITINFNLSGEEAPGKDLSAVLAPPSPKPLANETSAVVPSPPTNGAATHEDGAVPTPHSVHSSSAQVALPRPVEQDAARESNNYALPTPIIAAAGEKRLTPSPLDTPSASTREALPKPTADVAGTAQQRKQSKTPTPNDGEPLAEAVNETIDDGKKKSTRRPSTTKNKKK